MRSNVSIIVGLILGWLLVVSILAACAEAQTEKIHKTSIEKYMKMNRRDQTTYMVGVIEAHNAAWIFIRMVMAEQQGRRDKEVEEWLLACTWDSYVSMKAYIEAALYRVPREEWPLTGVAQFAMRPLAERFVAGCPRGGR